MKRPEIGAHLEAADEDGWSALWWPRNDGGVTRFRAREERREPDRIRVMIHPEDQGLIGCELLEFVLDDDGEKVYFLCDVPTEFPDDFYA